MYGSIPVREEHFVGFRVLRFVFLRPGKKRGRFAFLRLPAISGSERAATHQAPTTHYPPTDQPTAAVHQQCSSTYRPIRNGSTQQCSSTQHSSTPGTRGGGWGFPFSYDYPPSRGEGEPSPGEPFHAPRSPSWKPSVVMSPGTPRAVRGGRGWGVRSLGAASRSVERVARDECCNRMFLNIQMTTTTTLRY